VPRAELQVVGGGASGVSPAGPPVRQPTATVVHLGADDQTSPRVRVVDAALVCLARQGLAKTTVDDIARQAGVSRATLYRTFPGGKEAVLAAVTETEVARFFSALGVAMGEAKDLEDVLVAGLVEATRYLSSHEALLHLLASEPGVVLPHLAFARMDRVLQVASDFCAPFFARWLEPDQAARAAEWAARIVMSYLACPSERFDLGRPEGARVLVAQYVLPGIQALRIRGVATARPRPTRSTTTKKTTTTKTTTTTTTRRNGATTT
jgi:AcrR family transcriptional regulator